MSMANNGRRHRVGGGLRRLGRAARRRRRKVAGTPVEKYADYRRVLDRKDIDAVIVATWDQHALPDRRGRLPRRQGRLRREADDARTRWRGTRS